ncbi:MAG TPA: nitrile hydratase accessory protein [Gammaproteobacteria bacterium]|nr:nitrile hydratase accessory protein [Gammaproteobacteria bacterium]
MTMPDYNRLAARTLPALPGDSDGPVFDAPWQAQAFAMTVKLHEAGVFEWQEWTTALSAEIARAQAEGDPDLGDTYYEHWLRALERLVVEKGLFTRPRLQQRTAAWARAAEATPHGEPIELARAAAADDSDSSPA